MVQVSQPLNKLLEEVFGNIFGQLATLPHVCEKVSPSAKFHDKANMLARLEGVIEADHALVI